MSEEAARRVVEETHHRQNPEKECVSSATGGIVSYEPAPSVSTKHNETIGSQSVATSTIEIKTSQGSSSSKR